MRLSPHQILDLFIAASFGLLCLLSATLAWIDIRHGIIPDWLNLAIAGLGLSTALSIDGPSPATSMALLLSRAVQKGRSRRGWIVLATED